MTKFVKSLIKNLHICLLKPLQKMFRLFKHEISSFFPFLRVSLGLLGSGIADSQSGSANPTQSRSIPDPKHWFELQYIYDTGNPIMLCKMHSEGESPPPSGVFSINVWCIHFCCAARFNVLPVLALKRTPCQMWILELSALSFYCWRRGCACAHSSVYLYCGVVNRDPGRIQNFLSLIRIYFHIEKQLEK